MSQPKAQKSLDNRRLFLLRLNMFTVWGPAGFLLATSALMALSPEPALIGYLFIPFSVVLLPLMTVGVGTAALTLAWEASLLFKNKRTLTKKELLLGGAWALSCVAYLLLSLYFIFEVSL